MKRALLTVSVLAACASWAAGARAATRPTCEDLRADLKSPNAKTREAAATALGRTRCQDSVTPLAALVRDPEAKVRYAVVRSLREMREASAVPALTTFLADGAEPTRLEAIAALAEVYGERDRPSVAERILGAFSDELDDYRVPSYVKVDPAVPPALGALLRDEFPAVRRAAAYALGVLRGRTALPELTTALADPDPSVRGEVVTAIEKTASSAAEAKALVPLIDDESGAVRVRALHALGSLRVSEAGAALRAAWEGGKRRDGEAALLEAMAPVRGPGLRDIFLQLVQDPDPTRRRCGIEGLARISDAGTLPGLKKDFQREGNEELRAAYCFALALLGDRAFVDTLVLALAKRPLGRRCRDYLLELGPTIVPDLVPYLSDRSADVRGELAELLGAMEAPEALPPLERLLTDPNSGVVDRATRAVERLRRVGEAAR